MPWNKDFECMSIKKMEAFKLGKKYPGEEPFEVVWHVNDEPMRHDDVTNYIFWFFGTEKEVLSLITTATQLEIVDRISDSGNHECPRCRVGMIDVEPYVKMLEELGDDDAYGALIYNLRRGDFEMACGNISEMDSDERDRIPLPVWRIVGGKPWTWNLAKGDVYEELDPR